MKKKWYFLGQFGSTFITALAFAAIFSIIGIGTLRLVSRGGELHRFDVDVVKSYWVNDGAIRLALRYLSKRNEYPLPSLNGNITSSITGVSSLNGYSFPAVAVSSSINSNNIRQYTFSCTTDLSSGLANFTQYSNVTVTSLNKYACLMDQSPTTWWKESVIQGNFHVNGEVMIHPGMSTGRKVTGAMTTGTGDAMAYLDAPYNRGIEFDGTRLADYGGTTNAEHTTWMRERLPEYSNGTNIVVENTSVLKYFTPPAVPGNPVPPQTNCRYLPELATQTCTQWTAGECTQWKNDMYQIVLRDNIVDVNIGVAGQWREFREYNLNTPGDVPNNIILAHATTFVHGQLDGRLTIANHSSHIFIDNDITYRNKDVNDPNNDDCLALMAGVSWSKHMEMDINIYSEFASGANPNYIRDSGLVVMANIYANRVWDLTPTWGYTGVKDLHFYGSVVTRREPGTMAYDSASARYKGLRPNYHQDNRFVNNLISPPFAPNAKAEDPEMSGQNMYLLNSGQWANRIIAN